MAVLLVKKNSVSKEYTNFLDIFFKKSMVIFLNCLNINKYTINLELSKQSPYRLIYNLGFIELKTLKTYIEANLINKFI